jgi:acyl-CoA dehydrogenase
MSWLFLILTLWALAYCKVSLRNSTLIFMAVLAIISLQTGFTLALKITWGLSLVVFTVLNITRLRQSLFSKVIFRLLQKTLPTMTKTENEALKAGNTWWDAELFSGNPDWKLLQDLPAARLTEEEQAFIDNEVENLCGLLNHWDISHHRHDFPPEVWAYIKQHKFGGMVIPRQYGGLGFSNFAYSEIVMKLYSRCSSVAISVMIPNSGSAKLVLANGTEAQKNYYLPRFASGEEMPAFALSGPQAGSDAGAMPDTGIVCYGQFNDEQILGIRLNWEKRYISFSPIATLLAMTFKLYDPEHLLGDKENLGVTIALIPTNTAGISIGQRHFTLDAGLQNGPNWGKEVFIPLDWIIGGQAQIGNGWKMLMQSLAVGRAISLPALSAGAAKFACRNTGAYARIRKQFNQPIGQFEGVEEVLARMAGESYLLEAARMVTAAAVDQGHHSSVIAAIIKYHATEKTRSIINDAMDIQGGSGICLGPKNYLAHLYQVMPIGITVEGANILTRSLMIFGQGAVRCHPFIQQEMLALSTQDVKQFDAVLMQHLGLVLRNVAACIGLGLTGARLLNSTGDATTRRYYQQISRLSAGFALLSDYALLSLGGSLKRRERISALFADVLSHLYLASTALKHFENQGSQDSDKPLLHWACQHSLYQAQQTLMRLFTLLPLPPVAWLLKKLIFPLGSAFSPPQDHLIPQLAAIVLNDCVARDRLTQGIYSNTIENDVSGRIELAFKAVLIAAPIEAKISAAQRQKQLAKTGGLNGILDEAIDKSIITEQEAGLLRDADRARMAAISVDVFNPDEL